jgi:hypothetical protein
VIVISAFGSVVTYFSLVVITAPPDGWTRRVSGDDVVPNVFLLLDRTVGGTS